jgi:hypothetical protein
MTRLFFTALLAAQTAIAPPNNSYSPADDVKLGQEAAGQAEQQLPIMRDDAVTSLVEGIGRRLVEAVPADLRRPEFRYTFKVVDVRDINAFALPGGAMYINRGMIEAARNEGEVAGVMAHELSHVVLRHGTAQASKATKYQIGAIAGAIAGAILGGNLGTVVSQGTRFGLGTAFLRYGRDYETQADLEGAQIMARAGYDPRDMANIFQTIEKQSGSGGPQWLSDHPNPGNRSKYIAEEAVKLRVENPVRDTREFDQVKAHLQRLPAAPSTEEVTRSGGSRRPGSGNPPSGNVERPYSQYTTFTEGDMFKVSVPSNWRELPGNNSVTFAPAGAYGAINGQNVFTHGVEAGISRNEGHDLETAADELIRSLANGNPDLRRDFGYERILIGSRSGLHTVLSNRSEATRRPERIELFATQLRDGSLFYLIGVAPTDEEGVYSNVFRRVAGSVRFTN